MFRVVNPNMINLQAQTITLPLNVYLELCSQPAGQNDEMDEFLMYTYKVKRCPRARAHDWTECPYAHRGEKARRRDPRKFPYQGVVCPEFKNGDQCKRGQNCEFAHGIFEFWLHPSRFRTRVCETGVLCPRKVCFFAHTPEQLRPEGAHHCSRWKQQGHASSEAPAAMEGDRGRNRAVVAATERALATVKLPMEAAVASSSSSTRGAERAMLRHYNDYDHLEWLVDLVDYEDKGLCM